MSSLRSWQFYNRVLEKDVWWLLKYIWGCGCWKAVCALLALGSVLWCPFSSSALMSFRWLWESVLWCIFGGSGGLLWCPFGGLCSDVHLLALGVCALSGALGVHAWMSIWWVWCIGGFCASCIHLGYQHCHAVLYISNQWFLVFYTHATS